MNLRDSKSRLILIVVGLGAALVIAVASCGGGGDDGSAQSTAERDVAEGAESDNGAGEEGGDSGGDSGGEAAEEILATVSGEDSLTLTFTRAVREDGGFLTVEGTLHNGGSRTWFDSAWYGTERELQENGFSMAGSTLTAKSEGRRYLILRDTTGRCLCTGFGSGVGAGDTVHWFAQFPEPDAGTTEVEFHIGQMPPATIEIR
ncbi:hypothetical protein PJ985_05100 [Streptomyces sp. ACA25]|uniref:hypothetical protein n=1 Tax=Streptomyces sp. ACA25 TaxID=3022596 RepID=UPI0023079427|nr:hypothetical protein [Streptomyces sp. ACA25]MDB1086941.1 hypothetical protein [Streptomyces sp. ACA25]